MIGFPDAVKDQEFRDKIGQAREAQGGHHKYERYSTEERRLCPESAHKRNTPGMNALIDGTRENKQGPGAETVRHQLPHHSLKGKLIEGKYPKDDEAHVTNTGVRHQPLEVGLSIRQYGAIQNPKHPQRHGKE